MLALSPRIGLIHEPFSPITPPGVSSAPFDRFFRYVTDENEGPYVEPFERMLRFRYGLRRQLPTIRTPRDVRPDGEGPRELRGQPRARVAAAAEGPDRRLLERWLASRFDAQAIAPDPPPRGLRRAASSGSAGRTTSRSSSTSRCSSRDHLAPFEDEIRDFAEHRGTRSTRRSCSGG